MKIHLGPGDYLIIPFVTQSSGQITTNRVPLGWWYVDSPSFKLIREASYLELHILTKGELQ